MNPKFLGCVSVRVAKAAALLSLLLVALAPQSVQSANIVKWGPATTIVSSDQNMTVGKGELGLSLASHSNPAVGASYYSSSSGATPEFYGVNYGFIKTVSNPSGYEATATWKVLNNTSTDRLWSSASGPTDSTESAIHHLYLWDKADFLAGSSGTVDLDTMGVSTGDNGSGTATKVRFVIRLNTSYYVSPEYGEGTQSFGDPATVTWRNYSPETNFTSFSGAVANLTASDFANLTRVGVYVKGTAVRFAQTWINDFTITGTVQTGGGTSVKDYVAGLPTNANIGRTSTASLKIPGTHTLPTGASKSGTTINVTGNNVTLEDWNLNGHGVVVRGENCTIVNCILGESNAPSGALYTVDIYPTAHELLIEHNDFIGYNGEGGANATINQRSSGSGLTITTSANLTIRCNKFLDGASDYIKTAGAGALIEWNAFLDPVNINSVPALWSSTTVYNLNQYALNSSNHLFKSKINNNVNHPVPSSKTSDTYWQNYDPHVDHITMTAAPGFLTIQYNYFSRGDLSRRVQGMNNALRFVRNTGTTHLVEDVLCKGNVIEENNKVQSLPIQITDGGNPNYVGPLAMRHNWLGKNKGGSYYYNPINISNCIWDTNKDVLTGAAIATPTGCTTQSTTAPSVSVVPSEIQAGHS